MPIGSPVVTWAIYGPRATRNPTTTRYAPARFMYTPAFIETYTAIGKWYEEQVKSEWAKKHGRSGETEESVSGELTISPGPGEATVYGVRIAGNVGFVLNPLPPHVIVSKVGLAGPTNYPGQGREVNFYDPFGPVKEINWFQGGGTFAPGQSYSPDPTWYESLEPILRTEGLETLSKIGNRVANLWGEEGVVTTKWAGFP